jgi:hypothetical protein
VCEKLVRGIGTCRIKPFTRSIKIHFKVEAAKENGPESPSGKYLLTISIEPISIGSMRSKNGVIIPNKERAGAIITPKINPQINAF